MGEKNGRSPTLRFSRRSVRDPLLEIQMDGVAHLHPYDEIRFTEVHIPLLRKDPSDPADHALGIGILHHPFEPLPADGEAPLGEFRILEIGDIVGIVFTKVSPHALGQCDAVRDPIERLLIEFRDEVSRTLPDDVEIVGLGLHAADRLSGRHVLGFA